MVYVVADDPDALFERAKRGGATVIAELKDEDYGSRGFTVADPEANLWSVGTYHGNEIDLRPIGCQVVTWSRCSAVTLQGKLREF